MGNVGPLYRKLAHERVVDQLHQLVAMLRSCLRACIDRTQDPAIQNLLWVIAELLDECSTISLPMAVHALSGDGPYQAATVCSSVPSVAPAGSDNAPSARLEGLATWGAPPRPKLHGLATGSAQLARFSRVSSMRSLTPMRSDFSRCSLSPPVFSIPAPLTVAAHPSHYACMLGSPSESHVILAA